VPPSLSRWRSVTPPVSLFRARLCTAIVTPVNDPPVATDDVRDTAEDAPLVVSAASLLANDSDPEGGALTLTGVGNASNGTVALSGGTVTFTRTPASTAPPASPTPSPTPKAPYDPMSVAREGLPGGATSEGRSG
jgi:hypothetical protein